MGERDEQLASPLEEGIAQRERAVDAAAPGLWGRYRRLPANVFALSLVSLFNDTSSDIIYPFLSIFLTTLGASPLSMGIIEGAAETVSSFLKLFAGYFSDRRGRRKGLVVFGYALSGVIRTFLAFATTWTQVFAIRVADRVGKGVRGAPRDAMIADAATPSQRGLAFGLNRAMDNAGAVVGPLLGFLLLIFIADDTNHPQAGELRTLFLLAAIPALAAVLVAAFFVREKRREERIDISEVAPAPLRFSLRGFDANFKRFLVILALFTLANSSDLLVLRRVQEAGVGAASIPLLWAALHVCKVVSSLFGGDLSDRLGRKRLIVSGWILYAAVYAGLAFVSSVGQAWALFLLYGIYFGLTEGAEKALVADLVPATKRGTAYGLYNLAFSVTVLPASLMTGALWKFYGAHIAFLTCTVISMLAALLLLLIVRTEHRSETA